MQTQNRSRHDVVIVGGRVAGSATAMLLARRALDRGPGRRAARGEPLRPHARRALTGEPVVDLGEIVDAEIPPCLRRRASEGQMAVPGQEDHLVTPVDGSRLVGGEDDRDASPGEPAQQAHDLCRRRWVQA